MELTYIFIHALYTHKDKCSYKIVKSNEWDRTGVKEQTVYFPQIDTLEN